MLTELVAAYPQREEFVAALMRALAESGRSAEVLTVYQTTRERFAEELGVDPSTELSALHTGVAIELAAARLRTMSIDQLARRLDDRFQLLTSGSRTALLRHKTLRAVIDWSWDLLTEAERSVLRRLAVFSGSASLEAAERVCADGTLARGQVLELLTALTEKSLLRVEGGSTPVRLWG